MSLEAAADVNQLRATAHPIRLQMLSLLTGAELSAAEVARELGITHANASYHLRFLHSAGLLDITGEERVRGGLAKRYRHVWDSARLVVDDATEADKTRYMRTLSEAITRRFAGREPGGPSTFTDADLWVEPEVWQQVVELAGEASRLLHASARPPRTRGARRVNLSVAAFPLKATESGPR